MSVVVRPANECDLDQVRGIFAHYVENTVVTFLTQPPPSEYITSRYEASLERQLPYLVAVDEDTNKVVGYAYASAFRGFMLGYGHSVEMSLFCAPEWTKKGIGSKMTVALLEALRHTRHLSYEVGNESNKVEFDVRKVFAIMAVDESAEGGGLGLRDWYMKWGFEQVGRLKGVGYKDGRILDTIYMELDLSAYGND